MSRPQIMNLSQLESTDSKNGSWLAIGKVLRTVGLQGWVRIGLKTDYPQRFCPGSFVYVKRLSGSPELIEIAEWREHFSGVAIEVRFDGIETCDNASDYVNTLLVIPYSEREELTDDTEFYPDELEGMKVIAPDGSDAGVVEKLEAEAASPYLVVRTVEQGEILIPFLKVFISSVDRKTRCLRLVKSVEFHIPVE